MTDLLQAQVEGIPVGRPNSLSVPYWEGCRIHELRYQQCQDCDAIPPLPAPVCPHSPSHRLVWRVSLGNGSLYSWTVVWRPQHPAFGVPYAPAIVKLDEGPYVMSAMVGCRADDLGDGLPVAVEFHAVDEVITLPFFHPRS